MKETATWRRLASPQAVGKVPNVDEQGVFQPPAAWRWVAPERKVRVGILEDRHRCEFSHRLPMPLSGAERHPGETETK